MRSIDRRKLLAVIVAVFILSAGSVTASSHLAVGSSHDTDTEFESQQLSDLDVEGSGTGASVVLSDSLIRILDESFEDDNIGSRPDGWSSTNGDGTGVSNARSTDGSQSYRLSDSDGNDGRSEYALASATTESFSADIYADSNGHSSVYLLDSGNQLATIGVRNGDLMYYDGSSWQMLSTAVDAGEWTTVTISDVDPSADTVTVSWDSASTSGSQSDVPLRADMPASGYNEVGVAHFVDDGTAYDAWFDDISITGSETASGGQYIGTHEISNAEEAAINIAQASNVSVDVTIRGEGGTTLASGTYTSAGEKSLSFSSPSSTTLETVIDITTTGDNPQFELSEESVLFEDKDPQVSGGSPASGFVNELPVQLNISVSDADFPTSQGDSVTVEFTNEDTGSTIGTDTLTSNGTATATFDSPQGGANNWSATATDSYGNTVSSQTFTFNAPSELEIRDEESPGTLLTDANVTIEFYPQGADRSDVVTRPATDGTVDMTGLDVDSDFIAVAKADGYANRRIYVESLIETQEIYLLNESSDTVDIQFELEDFSGEYQQDSSVLIVEREINGQMTPVQGDFFGATGRWEATLKRDTRHRIRIKNLATGQVRTLGPFTPQTSGVQTVTVEPDGAVQLNPEFSQVSAQPALGVIPAEDQAVFGVEIEEGDETINSYSIEVRHMDQNGTATTLATRTGTGASVEEFTLNLTGLQGQVIANVDVETDSGTRSVVVSREIRESYPGADGLLGGLLEVGSGLGVGKETGASGASSMAAFFLSVLVTGAVARQTRASADLTGLTALGSLTAFAIIGWLSMQVLFAVAVAFAGALTLRRGI